MNILNVDKMPVSVPAQNTAEPMDTTRDSESMESEDDLDSEDEEDTSHEINEEHESRAKHDDEHSLASTSSDLKTQDASKSLKITSFYTLKPSVNGFVDSKDPKCDREFPTSRNSLIPSTSLFAVSTQSKSGGDCVDKLVYKPTMSLFQLAQRLRQAEFRVFGHNMSAATTIAAIKQRNKSPSVGYIKPMGGYNRKEGFYAYDTTLANALEDAECDEVASISEEDDHSRLFGKELDEDDDLESYGSHSTSLPFTNVKPQTNNRSVNSQVGNSPANLTGHMIYMKTKSRHRCRYCPYSSDRQSRLKRHELAVHYGKARLKNSSIAPKTSSSTTSNIFTPEKATKQPDPAVSNFPTAAFTLEEIPIPVSVFPNTATTVLQTSSIIATVLPTSNNIESCENVESLASTTSSSDNVMDIKPEPDDTGIMEEEIMEEIPLDLFPEDIIGTVTPGKRFDPLAEPRKHRCPTCPYSTDTITHLKRHISCVHNREKMFRCNICPDIVEFTRAEKARVHFAKRHPDEVCDIDAMRLVKKVVKNVSIPPPRIPAPPPPPSSKRPGEKDSELVAVDDANADAEVQELVNISIANKVKGLKPFTCPQCPYSARDVWHMRRHIGDRHVKRRHYKCRVCLYETGRIDRLFAHQRSHGEMFCLYCDNYSTAHADSFKRHMTACASTRSGCSWEGGPDPFRGAPLPNEEGSEQERTCRLCNVMYENMPELERHIDNAHLSFEGGEFGDAVLMSCLTCQYQTCDRGEMYAHVNSHAPNIFECDGCDFKATYARTLEIHKRYYHGDISGDKMDVSGGENTGEFFGDMIFPSLEKVAGKDGGNSGQQRGNTYPESEMKNGFGRMAASTGGYTPDSIPQHVLEFFAETGNLRGDAFSAAMGQNAAANFGMFGGGRAGGDHRAGADIPLHHQPKSIQARVPEMGYGLSREGSMGVGNLGSEFPASVKIENVCSGETRAGRVGDFGGFSNGENVFGNGSRHADISYGNGGRMLEQPSRPLELSHATTQLLLNSMNKSPRPYSDNMCLYTGIFRCPVCVDRAPFKYRRSFEKHLLQHASAFNLCPLCTETFPTAAEVERHVVTVHNRLMWKTTSNVSGSL